MENKYQINLREVYGKHTPHYTARPLTYILFNQGNWRLYGRMPYTIINRDTGKSKTINEKLTLEQIEKTIKELE